MFGCDRYFISALRSLRSSMRFDPEIVIVGGGIAKRVLRFQPSRKLPRQV